MLPAKSDAVNHRPETPFGEEQEWIEQLQVIRGQIAPLVIASDIRQGDEWIMPVVELLGNKHILDNIQTLGARLRQVGISTDVSMPMRMMHGVLRCLTMRPWRWP